MNSGELIRLSQGGDERAKNKLIKHNIGLVISIAKKYLNQGLDYEELIQEGQIGLVRAIEKFDLNKTIDGKVLSLSTYATWWVRQAITRSIDNSSRTIRIPIHKLNEYRTIKREYSKFRAEFKKDPTPEELEEIIKQASILDPKIKALNAKEIQLLGRMLYPLIYLNQANSDDENLTMLDYISINSEEQPEQVAEISANQEYVTSLLAQLEEEERNFILVQFGFLDGKKRDKKEMLGTFRKLSESEIQKKIDYILNKLEDIGIKERVNLD